MPFFWTFFSTFPSTQTKKVIDLIFFKGAGLEKLGYEHAFQPYTYSLRLFSKGGDAPPQSIHRFRPPSLVGSWDNNNENRNSNQSTN